MSRIVLFTLNGCEFCESLKNRLNDENIAFEELEITQNRPIWNQVIDQTGLDLLPSVLILSDSNDRGKIFMPGEGYQNQDEIIQIIKAYH